MRHDEEDPLEGLETFTSRSNIVTELHYKFPKATPQRRLGGLALDFILQTVTLGIGWLVWSFAIWGKGQTPGKQILKLRVYNQDTKKSATWGVMALRQFFIPLSLVLTLFLIIAAANGINASKKSFDLTVALATVYISYAVFSILVLVDAFWIFKDKERHRLIDKIAKTDVLDESAALLKRQATHKFY